MDGLDRIFDNYAVEVDMKVGRSCYKTKYDAKMDIKYYEKEIKYNVDNIKKKKKLLKEILEMPPLKGAGPFVGELVLSISASKKAIKRLGVKLEQANAGLEILK